MANTTPTILVTGFDAFQEFDRNPSEDIAEAVNNKKFHGFTIKAVKLPVSWQEGWPLLQKSAKALKPVAWLGFGLAPDPFIRLEKIARNQVDYSRDESGELPPHNAGEILIAQPPELPSTLPLDWIREQLLIRNFTTLHTYPLEVRYSEDAGGYLCNHVFYNAMFDLKKSIPVCGFIHVPAYKSAFEADRPEDQDIVENGVFIVEVLAEWLAKYRT